MDDTTDAVRALYERFPYPAGAPELRVSFDAEALLGEVALTRGHDGPLRVLDAGCGRGLGLLGAAALQPTVQFVGVDLSRASLADAQSAAEQLGLDNVQLSPVDLCTLEGLEVPAGGFDVIHSSGVIHHMQDPAAALARLAGVLAPHGVLVLMVYAKAGREGYARVTQAIDAVVPREAPVGQRLGPARAVVDALRNLGEFAEAARVDDVEFVDRYLHVQEVSYDIPGLRALVRDAGLSMLRWCDPVAWSPDTVPAPLRAGDLDAVLDAIHRPRTYELLLVHPHNGPRPALTPEEAGDARFRVNPEITFELVTRAAPEAVRQEALRFRRSTGPARALSGVMGVAGQCLREQVGPFTGYEFGDALMSFGAGASDAGRALVECLHLGLIVRLPG